MADNVPVTAGSGVSIAADDIGGVHHQRVKIGVGADGASSDAQPADADAKAATGLLSVGNMVIGNGGTWNRQRDVGAPTDAAASTGITAVGGFLYNGATYDHLRGNTEGTLLASAARTVATASATQTNYNARGVIVYLNVTAASGTGGLGLLIIAGDPVAANLYALNATPTTVTATGLYGYEVSPGASGTTTQLAQRTSGSLPRTWQIYINVGNASSYTYSVGYSLIV
jgi:hypothetical protein